MRGIFTPTSRALSPLRDRYGAGLGRDRAGRSPPSPGTTTGSGARRSPRRRRIVTASGDGTARVWDAATGREVTALRGHEDEVNSAVFSPDGARIVTGSGDKTARIWDATTGGELAPLRGHGSWVDERRPLPRRRPHRHRLRRPYGAALGRDDRAGARRRCAATGHGVAALPSPPTAPESSPPPGKARRGSGTRRPGRSSPGSP